jgi:hypothetical protein
VNARIALTYPRRFSPHVYDIQRRRECRRLSVLLREEGNGVLAIGQPSHAWISGQLARAWGNDRFGVVEPWEEVCLAAEQHDVGMSEWDLEPTFNPHTGRPHAFTEMPLDAHLACWRSGPRRLMRQSRYAALLCSMHGTRLYELRDLERMSPADAAAVRAFLSEQRGFQDRLIETLPAGRRAASGSSRELIARNSQLLWTWDFLSLALCLSWAPCRAKQVPSADGEVELELSPGASPGQVVLDPWPLRPSRLTVRCEGQRLTERYDSDAALRRGLAEARWETLEVELIRSA